MIRSQSFLSTNTKDPRRSATIPAVIFSLPLTSTFFGSTGLRGGFCRVGMLTLPSSAQTPAPQFPLTGPALPGWVVHFLGTDLIRLSARTLFPRTAPLIPAAARSTLRSLASITICVVACELSTGRASLPCGFAKRRMVACR